MRGGLRITTVADNRPPPQWVFHTVCTDNARRLDVSHS